MGLIDFVCDVVGGVAEFVGGAISTVASAIGSAFSAAVSVCKTVAKTVIAAAAMNILGPLVTIACGVLGPVLGPVVAELIKRKIEEVLRNLLGGLEDERTDEMGYRIEEAENHDDWKKSDEFESFNEYYEYLKQQIPDEEIDQAKLSERKYFYEAIAINTLAEEVGKKYDIAIEPDFLMEIGRSAMDTKEAEAIIAAYKNLGYNSVAFSDYLNGKLSPSEVEKVRAALLASLKGVYPEKDGADFESRLAIMEICSTDDKYVAKNIYSKSLKAINKMNEAQVAAYLKE